MPPIRVLVVDDSVVARRMVTKAIEEDDALEVVGVAVNGLIALDKLTSARPDVMVLDLEMPVMDGYQTLKALRLTHPTLPVIVFSNLSARGAKETLDAMALGASGFVLKPEATGPTGTLHDELIPLIKALAAPRDAVRAVHPHHIDIAQSPVDAVVIAVSTGGPNALATLVAGLPGGLPTPVLIVQHMPPMFTELLAARLDGLGPLTVTEATDGEPIAAGHVYLAPGGRHLAVRREGPGVLAVVHDGPMENSCRPAADVLFRAAAEVYGSRTLAVVLTGMGHDGLRGTETIVAAGGTAVAQDQETSVVGSMPGAIADAGLAEAVLPLEEIAAHIVRRTVPARARP